jgi:hypothetical protein
VPSSFSGTGIHALGATYLLVATSFKRRRHSYAKSKTCAAMTDFLSLSKVQLEMIEKA